jgi:SAM-dependent methyltransferase
MKECSKSIQRRLNDSSFLRRYFVGEGLDIGGKPDPLSLYSEFFPLVINVKTWDWEDGDAQFLTGVADGTLNFVHSSHCLEHLVDPVEGLRNWLRVIKEGGYLIITIPDEDMYEQGEFPSSFNRDHKWTFTVFKSKSWSHRSINLLDMVRELGSSAEVVKIEQLSANYRFDLPRYDQTLTPVAECGIELIIRKRTGIEIETGGRWMRSKEQPTREMRLHLNQYIDDMKMMKQSNSEAPPFTNDAEI